MRADTFLRANRRLARGWTLLWVVLFGIPFMVGGVIWYTQPFDQGALSPTDECRLCVCNLDGKRCECVGPGYVATGEWQAAWQACGHCVLPACNEPVPVYVLRKQQP